MNYYRFFKNTALRLPNQIAVKFQNRHYSYRELDDRICRLASVMKQYHVGKGKHVGLICTNCSAYLEIVLAASMLGAVSEQFNWRTSSLGMAGLIEDSLADLIFISADLLSRYQNLSSEVTRPITIIPVEGNDPAFPSYETLLAAAPANSCVEELSHRDPLFIFYTSGTTAKPKRVLLSIGSVFQHNMANICEIGWKEGDVFLQYLPLFHTSSSGSYCTLFTGGTIILQHRFNADVWIRTVKEEKVTSCGMVPNTIAWLTDHPGFSKEELPSLRWMIYAGGPMPYEVLKKAIHCVGSIFIQLYGMTEMCPTIAILTPQDHTNFIEAGKNPLPNGRPLLGSYLSIVDENDQPCEPYVTGEVIVQSDQMMLGYEGQPELTAQVTRNGWYHTGDLGYLDERQYLYLVGRKNRMIITGGENVYPIQVENCIRSMGGMIRDVAVLGIPDSKWGEAVAAVIVLHKDCTWKEADILQHCQEQLPGYMKPHHICFAEQIPHNESGKVMYEALEAFFNTGPDQGPVLPASKH